jgi:GDPmannose 4,6-dehydratase
MLQQEEPRDFVIASGIQASVRTFVELAAKEMDLLITWTGKAEEEIGTDQNGRVIVRVDKRYFRPTEVETLLGDPTLAKEKLGWSPKTTLQELVAEMAMEDLKLAERDELVKKFGYTAYDYHE